MSDEERCMNCRFCGLLFMPVEFLDYRMMGYCTEGCMAHEKRTTVSAEAMAYKNGFPLKKRVVNDK